MNSVCSWLCAWAITGAMPLDVRLLYRPTSSLFAPNFFLPVVVPWTMWIVLMGILLKHQENDADHVDMQPQLSRSVGYWELGDTWRARSLFTFRLFR